MNFNKFSLFKMPREYKRFEYVPRYYDPRKEELQRKVAEYEATHDPEKAATFRREISFRSNVADRWGHTDYKAQTIRANIRLILILAGVLLVFYFFFRGLDWIGPVLDTIKK